MKRGYIRSGLGLQGVSVMVRVRVRACKGFSDALGYGYVLYWMLRVRVRVMLTWGSQTRWAAGRRPSGFCSG